MSAYGVRFYYDGTEIEVEADGARSWPSREQAWAVARADFDRCLPSDVQPGDRIEGDEERGALHFYTAAGGFSVELVSLYDEEPEAGT